MRSDKKRVGIFMAFISPARKQSAVYTEYADALAKFRHIDRLIIINKYIGRTDEVICPLGKEVSSIVEDLYAAVFPVRHPDSIPLVNKKRVRKPELSGL